MPRSKKGKRGSSKPGIKNGVKGESGASDDELMSDILSHYSSASEGTSVLDEGTGGGEEQAAAATVFALLCIQLGGGDEAEEGFKMLRPILTTILIDNTASIAARQSCARALGMCCYVSSAEDGEDLIKSLALLESAFMTSYPNREGTLPTPKPGNAGLHTAALQAWSLLVTICPASKLTVLLDLHLPKLQACLQSSDVNYRIAVGETIALLEFDVEDSESLCECLKSLATDSNKHRAKNDRRKQRSIFREVLHYIENEDFTDEKIRFGVESIYIDSWMRRRIYDAFKEILESGVRHHLQFNPLLRDIFGLGPPLILDTSVKSNKISRFEKHLFNSAAFKARTKQRNKVRDKRADQKQMEATQITGVYGEVSGLPTPVSAHVSEEQLPELRMYTVTAEWSQSDLVRGSRLRYLQQWTLVADINDHKSIRTILPPGPCVPVSGELLSARSLIRGLRAVVRDAGGHQLLEDRSVYCEDWGEALTNKSVPVVCVVNLQSGTVSVLQGVPPDVSPGQALWAPGSQSVFFVGWYHEPFRLGLRFCSNR
eukprot:superscaffoldBa00006066_g21098